MTKWLAVVTGCITGIALLGLSWIVSLSASLVIIGAVIGPYFPRARRLFMLGPALILSALVLPMFLLNFRATIFAPFVGPRDFGYLAMAWCWLLSPILLVWCIGAVATMGSDHQGESR